MQSIPRKFTVACGVIALLAVGAPLHAQAVNWAGYTWNVNPGSGIGDGLVIGNANNVSIDGNGNLHLKMTKSGSTWTGAELGTQSNLGFGSYYWVFSGPLTSLEQQDVVGSFPYGPQNRIGVDGENEIDVEFSRWNVNNNAYNGDFTIYPSTGHKESSANINWTWTSGTIATCRVDWTSTRVTESIWSGVVPTNASTSSAAITWTYNGNTTTIPQSACPFLFNVWSYGVLPTQAVDIVVKKFQFIGGGGTVPVLLPSSQRRKH